MSGRLSVVQGGQLNAAGLLRLALPWQEVTWVIQACVWMAAGNRLTLRACTTISKATMWTLIPHSHTH